MTFNSTIGDEAANSYISVEQADNYHEGRLHNSEWVNANTATKQASLRMATAYLENMPWKGFRSTTEQSLAWPRSDVAAVDGREIADDVIPRMLINATAELAWELLRRDRFVDSDSAGIKAVKAGAVEVEFDRMTEPNSLPVYVLDMLKHLMARGWGTAFASIERA